MGSIFPVLLPLYLLGVLGVASLLWDPRAKRIVIPISMIWPLVFVYALAIFLLGRAKYGE